MSPALRTGGGGTFCRFTIGAGVRGASARYLHYIANSQAVREGKEGVWLKEFPDVLERASYPVMVETLLQYARRCEQREFIIGHKNNQKIRTHYTAMLSFETAGVYGASEGDARSVDEGGVSQSRSRGLSSPQHATRSSPCLDRGAADRWQKNQSLRSCVPATG